MSQNAPQHADGMANIFTVTYGIKNTSVVENQRSPNFRPIGREKMCDMCKYWGITPQERIDVVNKINSRAKITHAKAQTLLWFGTMNV